MPSLVPGHRGREETGRDKQPQFGQGGNVCVCERERTHEWERGEGWKHPHSPTHQCLSSGFRGALLVLLWLFWFLIVRKANGLANDPGCLA